MSKQLSKLIFPGVISALGIFAVAILLFSACAPVGTHATGSELGVNIDSPDIIESGGYYILVEHNPSTSISLNSFDANGFYNYNNDSLKVYTNSPSGYQLYISSDQDGNFDPSGSGDASTATNAIPGNSLFKNGTLGNTEYFGPAPGEFTPPSTAVPAGGTAVGSTSTALNPNTWGFSMTQNDYYAAIPLKNNETLVKKTRLNNSTRAADDTSVAQNIYYGVRAALSKTAGTYSGNVLYTAMSDADSVLDGVATISPDTTTELSGGEEVTIRTSLFTNMEDLGDISVYIGDYSSTSDTPVAADACTNISSSIDTDANNNLVITCDTPAKTPGTYDVLVLVEKFGKAYLISDGLSYTVDLPAFWTITYMQDMTPAVCNSVYTPTNVTGSSAVLVDKTSAMAGNYLDVTADNTSPKVAQHTLYDYRGADGTGTASNKVAPDSANAKSYTVRKLADGNCWMTQDLEIPLASGTTIEASYNTTASAYSFTPSAACSGNGACSMNANTKAGNGTYYYSWYAATAETGTSTDVSIDTSASICPIGWRLPANYTIDQTKSYSSLTNSYGFTTNGANNSQNHVAALESAPLNFTRSGFYYNGSLTNNSTDGYYWSSTAYTDAMRAYDFDYNTSRTNPQDGYGKYGGFNVRCVAQ